MNRASPLYRAEINVAITWEISARLYVSAKMFENKFAVSCDYKMLGQQGEKIIAVLLQFCAISFVLLLFYKFNYDQLLLITRQN